MFHSDLSLTIGKDFSGNDEAKMAFFDFIKNENILCLNIHLSDSDLLNFDSVVVIDNIRKEIHNHKCFFHRTKKEAETIDKTFLQCQTFLHKVQNSKLL